MPDQILEELEKFWLAAKAARKLGALTLKLAANLSPSDREEVLKLAMTLEFFTERLRELAASTDSSLADLRSGIEASTENLSSTIEILGRILTRTEDPDQPVN